MILDHKTLDLYGSPAFTWVTLKTPNKETPPIPSDACFAYIVDGDDHILAEDIRAEAGKMILSLCGYAMQDMISTHKEEEGMVSTIVVHFRKETLLRIYEESKPPQWSELETPVVRYLVQESASMLIRQYCQGLVHLFRYPAAATEDILVLKLKEIILLLLQTDSSSYVQQIVRSLFSERSFTFREIIDANICEPFSLPRLAGMTGHSLTSFKTEFKKLYGTTPASYIMEKRVEKVADLLKMSDMNVSEIGYKCGFTSPAHLSRAFREKFDMTPSEYRRKYVPETAA